MKYYPVPGTAGKSHEVINESGEHVADFEDLKECVHFCECVNDPVGAIVKKVEKLNEIVDNGMPHQKRIAVIEIHEIEKTLKEIL